MSVKEEDSEHIKIENIQNEINKLSDEVFLIQRDLANFKKAVEDDLDKFERQLPNLIRGKK
tara:strand:+ start:5145 stop:5327 length:183 start_codon:yes stop_codon:yes gene_type:complete